MKKYILLALSLSFIMSACPGQNNPVPVIDNGSCQLAETHLHSLCNADTINNKHCCDIVKPTLKGKSFSQFCTETGTNGIDIHADCLSKITSCNQIDACSQTK